MISPSSLNRETRARQTILKGVYEDNLRILGKRRTAIANRRALYIKKVLLVLLVTAFAIFLHAHYGSVPFSSDAQVAAVTIAKKTAAPVAKRTTTPVAWESSKPPHYPDLSGFKAIMNEPGMPLSRIFGLGVKTIMIDPGHGGIDSGTIGKLGTREKDLTLDVAKRLKALLLRDGHGRYRVLLTRDRDVTVPLDERVKMAIRDKADLFVSIHFNYIPHSPMNLVETFYFGPSSDDKALKLAERENAGSHYGMSDFRQIIEKLGDTMKLQESMELAGSIQHELFVNMKKEDGITHNYGVRRAPFVVLLGADVPAVLVEVSCLSNKTEERRLKTVRHREDIAHYLEAGILDYLNKGDIQHEKARYAER